jgi:hypothetical protein
MGQRGEIFSRKIYVKEGEKTYFFNIKENRYGDSFLNLVESSKKREGEGFQRNSIMVYKEDLLSFRDGFTLSQAHLAKKDKTNYSLEKGNVGARRKYHFSVKWNKFGWGSIFIAEEREGQSEDRRTETILIDERDLEDFMKGFEPVVTRLLHINRRREEKKQREEALKPEKKKIQIKKPPIKNTPAKKKKNC